MINSFSFYTLLSGKQFFQVTQFYIVENKYVTTTVFGHMTWKVYLIKRNTRGEKRHFTSLKEQFLTGLYYIVVCIEVSLLWRQN